MTVREREWVESPMPQGVDEEIVYSVDISKWGNSPTSISVVVKNEAGTDVTTTVMPSGAPSTPNPLTIQLPVMKSLTAGAEYRVEVKFTSGGQVLECYGMIRGET